MQLAYYKLPFIITILAGLLPWITSFPILGIATWLPETIAIGIFIKLSLSNRRNASITVFYMCIFSVFVIQMLVCSHLILKIGVSHTKLKYTELS